MVPPVQVACEEQVPALPTTVKFPLVFVRTIPLVPPVAEILVNEIARAVVLLLRVISRATAPLAVTVPLVTVIVFVLSVARSPR